MAKPNRIRKHMLKKLIRNRNQKPKKSKKTPKANYCYVELSALKDPNLISLSKLSAEFLLIKHPDVCISNLFSNPKRKFKHF